MKTIILEGTTAWQLLGNLSDDGWSFASAGARSNDAAIGGRVYFTDSQTGTAQRSSLRFDFQK